jgi:hypothetical protein
MRDPHGLLLGGAPHGHLPKAERAQLPVELQQRLAAWTTTDRSRTLWPDSPPARSGQQ